MAQLIVRNVDDGIIRALKLRAARNGRSAEAEHRALLGEALVADRGRQTFKEFLLKMPAVGRDSDFRRRKKVKRRIPSL